MIAVTVAHADLLAWIHERSFPPSERWDAAAFAELLRTPGAFGVLDGRGGFVLARQAGGEAEVLTLAVEPAARRLGVGRALMAALAGGFSGPVFLEVADDNEAALGLYASAGFVECGRRRGYYGPFRDALVLRRDP